MNDFIHQHLTTEQHISRAIKYATQALGYEITDRYSIDFENRQCCPLFAVLLFSGNVAENYAYGCLENIRAGYSVGLPDAGYVLGKSLEWTTWFASGFDGEFSPIQNEEIIEAFNLGRKFRQQFSNLST